MAATAFLVLRGDPFISCIFKNTRLNIVSTLGEKKVPYQSSGYSLCEFSVYYLTLHNAYALLIVLHGILDLM